MFFKLTLLFIVICVAIDNINADNKGIKVKIGSKVGQRRQLDLSQSVDFVMNEGKTVSSLIRTMWESLRVKVDTMIALFANPSEQTALQIESILNDIMGFLPKALTSTTTHMTKIKLQLENGIELTLHNRQKLYADLVCVQNNLISSKFKLTKVVDYAKEAIESKTASPMMKIKSQQVFDTFNVQITEVEILMYVSHYSSNYVKIGLAGLREDPAPAGDGRILNINQFLPELLAVLRVLLNKLFGYLNSDDYNNIRIILNQLSEKSANTWISCKATFKVIGDKLPPHSQLNDHNRRTFLAEIETIVIGLFAIQLRFEQVLKASYLAANRADEKHKFCVNSAVIDLKEALAQIKLLICEAKHIIMMIKTGAFDTVPNCDGGAKNVVTHGSTLPTFSYNISDIVNIFVTIINLGLTDNRVNQVESIVTDLEKLISTSIESIKTSLAVIKTKITGGQQLKDSEKLELSSNITGLLSILINLKTKIELALNTAIKSNDKNSDSVKTKADGFLLALRTQIIHIDQQIAQAIQLQINLNAGVSAETITEGSIEQNAESITEKSTTIPTHQTTAIETLGVKVDFLINGLKNKDFDRIENIVSQLKEPALKALNSVITFIRTVKTRLLSVSKISKSDKTKYLTDITSLLTSLLSIKVKCVLVLKATNEAATEVTGSVKTKIDKLISTFSAQMALIDAKITDVLQIQFKLNGGRTINFKFVTETKQTVNIEGTYKVDKSGTDAVLMAETIS